jgi:hypothetical protein
VSSEKPHPWQVFLENYIDPGNPAVYPLHGNPAGKLQYLPKEKHLTFVIHVQRDEPVETGKKNIKSGVTLIESTRYPIIWVEDPLLFREFYLICVEIIQRIQDDGETIDTAVKSTIAAFDRLLRSSSSVPVKVEIGLIGELLILKSLLMSDDYKALDYWNGTTGDQHDFRFSGYELEVKTTLGSTRKHWIHGTGQLVASDHFRLYLISIQLVRSTGKQSVTLSNLIDDITELLQGNPKYLEVFLTAVDSQLEGRGKEFAEGRFSLRGNVAIFEIPDDFPSINEALLESELKNDRVRIEELNYKYNFEGISHFEEDERLNTVVKNLSEF